MGEENSRLNIGSVVNVAFIEKAAKGCDETSEGSPAGEVESSCETIEKSDR
jgi:hypothetical protein